MNLCRNFHCYITIGQDVVASVSKAIRQWRKVSLGSLGEWINSICIFVFTFFSDLFMHSLMYMCMWYQHGHGFIESPFFLIYVFIYFDLKLFCIITPHMYFLWWANCKALLTPPPQHCRKGMALEAGKPGTHPSYILNSCVTLAL